MNKRGQLTMFIIVGIVVLATVAFLFTNNQPAIEEVYNVEEQPIAFFIDSCVEKTAEEGLYFLALQGGYYDAPESAIPYSFIQIPLYWDGVASSVPPIGAVETQLAIYVEDNLNNCIRNFEDFKEDAEFEVGIVSATAKIGRQTIVQVEFPVKVITSGSVQNFEKFGATVPVDFIKKRQFAQQIMDEQKKTPNSIPLGAISSLAFANSFMFENIDLGSGTVIYSLIFDEQSENDFVYAFAAQYDWSDLE